MLTQRTRMRAPRRRGTHVSAAPRRTVVIGGGAAGLGAAGGVKAADPGAEVIVYTVEPGDTLFGIAERYGLKPETVLWGNYFTLNDDPHSLKPGQELNILPVDGTYHFVTADNTQSLEGMAAFYQVDPQVVPDLFPSLHARMQFQPRDLTSPDHSPPR